MAEFLDGVKQGGGLATVADVTVSGGAVTELTTGTISLDTNKRYNLYIYIVSATTTNSTCRLKINGLTSGYSRHILYTDGATGANGVQAQVSNGVGDTGTTIGGTLWSDATLLCDGTKALIQSQTTSRNTTAKLQLLAIEVAASTITEVSIASDTASDLANGTNLLLTEAY